MSDDDIMLEAMREVDAMLPDTPPIAPPRLSQLQIDHARAQMASQNSNQLALLQAAATAQDAWMQQNAPSNAAEVYALMRGRG